MADAADVHPAKAFQKVIARLTEDLQEIVDDWPAAQSLTIAELILIAREEAVR